MTARRASYKKHWPRKTLGEVINFLEERHPEGLKIDDISRNIGLTPQGVTNMFMRDDMRLSKAEKIIEAYGYKLRLYFPVRRDKGLNETTIKRDFPKAGNLGGLVRYIKDSGYSIKFVSELSHNYPSVITRAFDTGDIMLSTLQDITDTLGITTVWKFEKINQQSNK